MYVTCIFQVLSGMHAGVKDGSFDVEFTTAADSLRLTQFLSTAGRVSLCSTACHSMMQWKGLCDYLSLVWNVSW